MASESLPIQWLRVRQHVSMIIRGLPVLHHNFAQRDLLSHVEVSTLDVSRAVARLYIFRQLHRSTVVDVQHRGFAHIVSKLPQYATEVHDLRRRRRRRNDFCLCAGQCHAVLLFTAITYGSAAE